MGKKQALKKALGNTFVLVLFFAFYAYTFFVGTLLKYYKVEMREGVVYSGGAIISIMFCVLFGGFGLGGAGPHFLAMNEGRIAGRMAFEVINHKPKIDCNDTTKAQYDKQNDFGDVSFENVTFRYPTKPEVPQIKDLTLNFKRGQTSALVGESGSGKSTIIQLIERFYDPESGSVKINGKDLKDFNLNSVRRAIGYV